MVVEEGQLFVGKLVALCSHFSTAKGRYLRGEFGEIRDSLASRSCSALPATGVLVEPGRA